MGILLTLHTYKYIHIDTYTNIVLGIVEINKTIRLLFLINFFLKKKLTK